MSSNQYNSKYTKPNDRTKPSARAKLVRISRDAALGGIAAASTIPVFNILAPKLTSKVNLSQRRLAYAGLVGGGAYTGYKSHKQIKSETNPNSASKPTRKRKAY